MVASCVCAPLEPQVTDVPADGCMGTVPPASLIELQNSVDMLHIEIARMSGVMRGVIHEELQQFLQNFSKHRIAWQRPSRGAASGNGTTARWPVGVKPATPIASPLLDDFGICWDETSMPSGNAQSPRGQLRKAIPSAERMAGVASPALSEPLLGGSARREETAPALPTRCLSAGDLSISASDRKRCIMTGWGTAEDLVEERLKQIASRGKYNVEDLYCKTGIWQAMAREDSWFSHLSLVVVAANVLWIGVDTDLDRSDILCNDTVLAQVMYNSFCVYFLFELVVRLLAFEKKRNAVKDSIFLVDLVLALFMVWETWIEVILYLLFSVKHSVNQNSFASQLFRLFRVFRLTRVPRIIRLSLHAPELMILVRGMMKAMVSVFGIMVLLGVLIFVFGVLFTELFRDTEEFSHAFGTVLTSMNTLLIQVLAGCDVDIMKDLLASSFLCYILYLLFIFLGVFTLMNMLIGVMCDVVSSVSEEEKDSIRHQNLEFEIDRIMRKIDADHDGRISKVEFDELMNCSETLSRLEKLGVDVVAFGGLTSFMFVEGVQLPLDEFHHLISQFFCSKTTTVKDLVDLRRFIGVQLASMVSDIKKMSNELTALTLPDI